MDVKNRCLDPISVPHVTGTTARILRCGHCPNCLRQKANELAVRAFREFSGQKVSFLTFTYNDDYCPVKVNRYYVYKDTGEMSYKDAGIVRDPDFFAHAAYKPISYKQDGHTKVAKRYAPMSCFVNEDDPYVTIYETRYPTIYYEDIKRLMKRFRISHPDVLQQYICVQEYGGKSYRPHYHMVLYGLSNQDIQDLVDDWEKSCEYGSVDVRHIQATKDLTLTEQVGKVAMYVAKYCCKGDFDCPYIKSGDCDKPKRAVSRGFGKGSPEAFDKLCKQVLAFDSFGYEDAWKFDTDSLSARDLSLLISRRTCRVNGVSMPFPKYLINKIFKKTIKVLTYEDRTIRIVPCGYKLSELDKIGLVKKTYKTLSSPLQTKIAHGLLADLVADYLSKQGQIYGILKDGRDWLAAVEASQAHEQAILKAAVQQFKTDIYLHSTL